MSPYEILVYQFVDNGLMVPPPPQWTIRVEDSQVHEEQGAHHQQEATQVGVEVDDHEQDATPGSRVHPVQPITFHVLLVLHHRPALRVHPHVLIGLTAVDEGAVLRRILVDGQVVDGVLVGQWGRSRDGDLLGRDGGVLGDSRRWGGGGGSGSRQRRVAIVAGEKKRSDISSDNRWERVDSIEKNCSTESDDSNN